MAKNAVVQLFPEFVQTLTCCGTPSRPDLTQILAARSNMVLVLADSCMKPLTKCDWPQFPTVSCRKLSAFQRFSAIFVVPSIIGQVSPGTVP